MIVLVFDHSGMFTALWVSEVTSFRGKIDKRFQIYKLNGPIRQTWLK